MYKKLVRLHFGMTYKTLMKLKKQVKTNGNENIQPLTPQNVQEREDEVDTMFDFSEAYIFR